MKFIKFFDWFLSLFKRKPKPIPLPERSPQQIENDQYRAKYRLEFLENVYFIQYYFNGEWWYLRIIDDDYILEEKRGTALRIMQPEYLENIITRHQNWLKGGRIFLPFK